MAKQCAAQGRLRPLLLQLRWRQAPSGPGLRLRRRGQHPPGLALALQPAPRRRAVRQGPTRRGHLRRLDQAPPGARPPHRQAPLQLRGAAVPPHVPRLHHPRAAPLRAQPRRCPQGRLVHLDRRGHRPRQTARPDHHGAARHRVRGRGAPGDPGVRGEQAQGAEHGAPVRGLQLGPRGRVHLRVARRPPTRRPAPVRRHGRGRRRRQRVLRGCRGPARRRRMQVRHKPPASRGHGSRPGRHPRVHAERRAAVAGPRVPRAPHRAGPHRREDGEVGEAHRGGLQRVGELLPLQGQPRAAVARRRRARQCRSLVVQAGVHDQRAQHQLGDILAGTRRGATHQLDDDAEAVYDEGICILWRWPESYTSGGDPGRRRDVAGVRAGAPGAANKIRQVLVLVLLVRGRRGAGSAGSQGDRRARLGRGPQHPAREAHLEPHGHDEQLLVPRQDQRLPPAQGRDRPRLRPPHAAGEPARRLDGAAETHRDVGDHAGHAEAEHLHALHDHRLHAVHHVRGAPPHVQGVGVDCRARPRLRLHGLPQGPPRRRRQHPHQRRLRLHRGVRRHPLRQGTRPPRDVPRRRARCYRPRLRVAADQPRRPHGHRRGPFYAPAAGLDRRARQPAGEGAVPACRQEESVRQRAPVPARVAVPGPEARVAGRQARVRVRVHRRQALHARVHADELRRGGRPRGAPHQDILQGRGPQVPRRWPHVTVPGLTAPWRSRRHQGARGTHRVRRPWKLHGGRRAAVRAPARHGGGRDRDHAGVPGDPGRAEGPARRRHGDAPGVRQSDGGRHAPAGGDRRMGGRIPCPAQGVVRGEQGGAAGGRVGVRRREGGRAGAQGAPTCGRRRRDVGARVRAAGDARVHGAAGPGEDGVRPRQGLPRVLEAEQRLTAYTCYVLTVQLYIAS